MYQPRDLAKRIFAERYALNAEESFTAAASRVAWFVASLESPDKIVETRKRFLEELVSGRFMPGGRIWYAAGRPKGQLLNCFVLPTEDSREGWGQTVKDSIIVSGTGGGVGINCSPVRPRGSEITGHAGRATGAVSLMDIINAAGEVIRAGGGRRTALMLCLNSDHPDVPEFLDKKLNLFNLPNANVSIVFMQESPEVFLKKVEADEMHAFRWRGKTIAEMPARKLWARMLDNAVVCGEPGLLNGFLANTESNIGYYTPLTSTNPCGEIWLEDYGCCDLGALVLPRFVQAGKVDRTLLAHTIYTAVRFLDNVLDVTTYPIWAIKENCQNLRRLGLGVMGLHDMLVDLGLSYKSDEGRAYVSSLMSFIKHKAYEASIHLAGEKGSFPQLDRDKFIKSGFCRRLKTSLREKILAFGIRNCALLTIAPTGTTALVAGVSSGIEPIYTLAHERRFRSGDALQVETVTHPKLATMDDTARAKLEAETALHLSLRDHLEMQAICQEHIDNAVAKTINLPATATGADVDAVIREYLPRLKGLTLYRDGSRGESPITPVPCPTGVCDV